MVTTNRIFQQVGIESGFRMARLRPVPPQMLAPQGDSPSVRSQAPGPAVTVTESAPACVLNTITNALTNYTSDVCSNAGG